VSNNRVRSRVDRSMRTGKTLVVAAAVLAGCATAPPPPPQPVPPAKPQPVAPPVELVPPVVVDAPQSSAADEAFRVAVRLFTARPGARRIVAAWGTLHLDGTAKRYRFATLDVILDIHDGTRKRVPGTAGQGTYIVEQAADRYWLVGFDYDASSFHHEERYRGNDGSPLPAEPAWLELDDVGIAHGQNHNHGKNHATIALRGGSWVVLREDDDNVRREPDEEIAHAYAGDDGVCGSPCPLLAGHHFVGGDLLALGASAGSIAELPDGVAGDWKGDP
jgi:hypothetical protein